jgi:hypothetical protein
MGAVKNNAPISSQFISGINPEMYQNLPGSGIRKWPISHPTGEFAHPNMIYFMKIHANIRRLAVGAALYFMRRVNSAVQTLGIFHQKALCALLFVSPKHFLNLVVQRLDSQAKGDGVVRPFARAALYRDDLLAVTARQGLFLNHLELNILAGGVTVRVPACSLSRRCSSPAGGNIKRSELGRGLQLRTRELCLWSRGKVAMLGTPGGLPFLGMARVAHCSCD